MKLMIEDDDWKTKAFGLVLHFDLNNFIISRSQFLFLPILIQHIGVYVHIVDIYLFVKIIPM